MNNQSQILRELSFSIDEALRRSEERLSHVERQLAGWSLPIVKTSTLSDSSNGWDELQAQANQATEEIDQELSAVQSSLTDLVQDGRQLKAKVV